MKRRRLRDPSGGGQYFDPEDTAFFSSGCTLLDMVLGGGWVENRINNVVGDKSTGKTLTGIEAARNYRIKYPAATIHYAEIENAFDKKYARTVGMPKDNVRFVGEGEDETPIHTVEDLFNDLFDVAVSGKRALYIVDSLDALSDAAEMDTKIGEGTYGTSKAKQISRLFRQLNGKLSKANVTVLIVSQVRDAIGVMFGKKHRRSGGKALDFYASQVVWLAHLKRLEKTRSGVKRAYGVQVKAKSEKSKVGMPFRECEFPILFAYGIEDVIAGVQWLLSVKRHKTVFSSEKKAKAFLRSLDKLKPETYAKWRAKVNDAVRREWNAIEEDFKPTRSKYN